MRGHHRPCTWRVIESEVSVLEMSLAGRFVGLFCLGLVAAMRRKLNLDDGSLSGWKIGFRVYDGQLMNSRVNSFDGIGRFALHGEWTSFCSAPPDSFFDSVSSFHSGPSEITDFPDDICKSPNASLNRPQCTGRAK
jgi:hypothetical protein